MMIMNKSPKMSNQNKLKKQQTETRLPRFIRLTAVMQPIAFTSRQL